MRVPCNWLREYIDYPYSPEELAHELTMIGLEVEDIEYLGTGLEGVVVGKIERIGEHPAADKLVICYVNTGTEELQIVTGAPNVREGIKVPVAPAGVELPGGLEVGETMLRGKKSQGMICSRDELGLIEERASGIMILEKKAEIGSKIVSYLGLDEYVLKLDLTPNYARCLGLLGIAREIRALLKGKKQVKYPDHPINCVEDEKIEDQLEIDIQAPDLCSRYTGMLIKNVSIHESPRWMQQRLRAAGIRPINNIVDITNYVLLEYNQPLHAFDYDKIKGQKIIVRRAEEGEQLVTLDDQKRQLNSEIMVIADRERPVGLAGVMGGANSEVTEETVNVLLEAACFDPVNIRKTSRKLGLPSEASYRFERGVDIENVDEAGKRAAYLMQELAGGEVVSGMMDCYPEPFTPEEITVDVDRVNQILGTGLAGEEMQEILTRLEFGVNSPTCDKFRVTVPSYRGDVSREADIIEEIARLYGYNRIETTRPESRQTGGKNRQQKIDDLVRVIMKASGLDEVYTFSLTDEKPYENLRLPDGDALRRWVTIKNPLNEAFSLLRTSLIPGIMDVLSENAKRQIEEMQIYEIGKVFFNRGSNKRPREELMLAGGSMGYPGDPYNNGAADFYYLKGVIENLFTRLEAGDYEFSSGNRPYYHPGRMAEISLGDQVIGEIGELLPGIIEEYDLPPRTTLFQVNFGRLQQEIELAGYKFVRVAKFPAVARDLALVVNEDITAGKIISEIESSGGELLREVELFDLYQGQQIPEGKKSLAFKLVLQAADRTLTDEEVNDVFTAIVNNLQAKYGAKVRGN